jgi:aryl-alcohol dehydrogenase-like predicted oxidoreductase
MVGARNAAEMRENLTVLDKGPLSDDEMARLRRIGDHIYGKPRAAFPPA